MLRTPIIVLAFVACAVSAFGTQWQVGPGQLYTMPSQVAVLVADGDTVNIAAGPYPSDVTNWTADDLLLRGIGGMAHLESNGNAWGGKGIWVIQGDRTTVENIEFSECSVPDENGAGIRQEGHHLTVRHCYFHDNENGILAGDVSPSTIRIEHTEFDHNGFGDGYSHNLYINHVDSLIFRFNYSHHAHVGHELKSRAHVNMIAYNRFSNEATGDASRDIDLPNGGQAYLIGNIIQQGMQAQNSNMVGYGLEGLNNPGPQELYAINNTLVNERSTGSFFSMPGDTYFKGYSNILAGAGSFMSAGFPTAMDTAGNLRAPVIASVSFLDPADYDYELLPSSPAQQIGIPAGLATSGYPLVAVYEYVHPVGDRVRCQQSTLDAGAYQLCTTDVREQATNTPLVWPNPAADVVHISTRGEAAIAVVDALGRTVRMAHAKGVSTTELSLDGLSSGAFMILVYDTNGVQTFRLVHQQ
ncbi:MAG: T9SS type A sorting domain-containing protein [Flavobacteriales bacterium]|nr:T9SS type A sorting domain-containing protein [Flavobacteriales bacterium]